MKIKSILLLVSCIAFAGFKLSDKPSKPDVITLVTYKSSNYSSSEQLNPDIAERRKNLYAAIESLEFKLYYNSTSSVFQLADRLEKYEDEHYYEFAKMLAGGLCYKNNHTKEKITQTESFDELFNVIKPYNEYAWQITAETKKINGYTCYKATAHKEEFDEIRKITRQFNPVVWFAPSIPVSYGPAGLDGLPGLVLEGTFNGRLYYYATQINFDSQAKINIERPSKGKYVTESEFLKIDAENFRKNN